MNNNPVDSKETLTRYCKMMHPDAKKAAKDSYLKVLQSSCLPDNTDLEELTDQLTNASSWNDGSDDSSVSICHMVHTNQPLMSDNACFDPSLESPCQQKMELSAELQPVTFPDRHMMRMLPSAMDHIITQPIPSVVHTIVT